MGCGATGPSLPPAKHNAWCEPSKPVPPHQGFKGQLGAVMRAMRSAPTKLFRCPPHAAQRTLNKTDDGAEAAAKSAEAATAPNTG